MSGQRIRRLSIWVTAALFVLGCIAPFAVSTPAQTVQSQAGLETSIVQTANAAQTQTATFMPTSTNTLLPTQTLLPTFTLASTQTPLILVSLTPTATPGFLVVGADGALVSVTPAIVFSPVPTSLGGQSTATEVKGGAVVKVPKEWDCKVLEKSPVKGSVIKHGVSFSAFWTVLNTGTKTWTNNGVDFAYSSGLSSEAVRKLQDLPLTVPPGSQISLRVPYVAPKNTGTYNAIWTLKVGNRDFCALKITFEVSD